MKYSPSAMQAWVSSQHKPPPVNIIAGERAARIALINCQFDPQPLGVHPDFVENVHERELSYQELSNDLENFVCCNLFVFSFGWLFANNFGASDHRHLQ